MSTDGHLACFSILAIMNEQGSADTIMTSRFRFQEVAQFLRLSCHNQMFSIVLIEMYGYGMLQRLNIPIIHLVAQFRSGESSN